MRVIPIIAVFVASAALTHLTHLHLNRVEPEQQQNLHETLPSEEALQLMSLTYNALVADYYWLRTINEFGDLRKHQASYPNLIALTRRVLALDPYFKTGYFFAGTALTVNQLDPTVSVELLEKGLEYRPDLWEIPFYLGFNSYYFLGDYERAARAMAQATTIPGAPEIAGQLATRLAAQSNQPELGIRMIDSILETIEDEKMRATYTDRRNILMVELHLSWLNQAIEQFRKQHGACPDSIEALVASGIMRGIPAEPLGGEYRVKECHALTTSKFERLRVHGKSGVWRDP